MADKYTTVERASGAVGEARDCGVKALSLLLRVPYNDAHEALRRAGRRRRRGTTYPMLVTAAKSFGYDLTWDNGHLDRIKRKKGSGVTMKTIADWLPRRGRFLLHVYNHYATVVNGSVEDWSKDRAKRIKYIITARRIA